MKISVLDNQSQAIQSVTVEPPRFGAQIPIKPEYQEILHDSFMYKTMRDQSGSKGILGQIDPAPIKNNYIASVKVYPEQRKVHVFFINGMGSQEITFDEKSTAWKVLSRSEIPTKTQLLDWFARFVIEKVQVDGKYLQPLRVTSWKPEIIDDEIEATRESRGTYLEDPSPDRKKFNALTLKIQQLKDMKTLLTDFNSIAEQFIREYDKIDFDALDEDAWHYFKSTAEYLSYAIDSLKGSVEIDPKVEKHIKSITSTLDLLR